MLAASFTNLRGILSGPVAFFEFKDFIIFYYQNFENVYKFPLFFTTL